jgi:hypothetical protein
MFMSLFPRLMITIGSQPIAVVGFEQDKTAAGLS